MLINEGSSWNNTIHFPTELFQFKSGLTEKAINTFSALHYLINFKMINFNKIDDFYFKIDF